MITRTVNTSSIPKIKANEDKFDSEIDIEEIRVGLGKSRHTLSPYVSKTERKTDRFDLHSEKSQKI